ncbi:Abhydrolase domain-containing protein C22H12.03 [Erysiphe neolycopersici]|uniref:Abhydrolase domain-containing protein C22H12.03 n=1 Tax=Erysiphe neolycopersici TaxID=212602 RepID=A0A420HBK8_9PEZI|nr:Abhydrolase domain-containing protein C22H12.03 [Erysiphe neolycopersici]
MSTTTLRRGLGRWFRTVTTTSTGPQLPLAYELHEPSKSITNSSPIIILHGLFGSKKNNRGISKVLARDLGRPVYAIASLILLSLRTKTLKIDLRNHGDSPHHLHHDYLSMARDVEGFIFAHALKKSTIIGHSMGAKTAMMLALVCPALVHDIVSVDNAPVRNMFQSNFSKYIQGLKRIEEQNVQKQSEADGILQKFVESLPVRQFLLGNFYRTEKGTFKSKVPLDILENSLENLRNFPYIDSDSLKFNNPALFIRGTKSKYVTDDFLPEIEKLFPRYRLVDVVAGHWLISENPEEFRKAVVNFLSPA